MQAVETKIRDWEPNPKYAKGEKFVDKYWYIYDLVVLRLNERLVKKMLKEKQREEQKSSS